MCRRYLAANGAIMRTSIMGVLNFNGELSIIMDRSLSCSSDIVAISDVPKVVVNTTEISKVTHADPRCTASCIAVTTAVSRATLATLCTLMTGYLCINDQIAMILRGDHNPSKKDGLKHLVEAALKVSDS